MSSAASTKIFTVAIALCTTLFVACTSTSKSSKMDEQTELSWSEILEEARWSANVHNVQSWRFRETDDGSLVGGLDPGRLLPETDPIARQLVLSLGAITGAASDVAASRGYQLEAAWIAPDGWSVATEPGADLFRWSLSRTTPASVPRIDGLTSATVKYRLEPQSLEEVTARSLESMYSGDIYSFIVEQGSARVAETLELAIKAYETEMRFEPTAAESYDLTRIGRRERREKPFGITLKGNFPRTTFWLIEPLLALFPQTLEQYAQSGIDLFSKIVDQGEALIVLTSDLNNPETWFEAGHSLQHIWMEVRKLGLELLPLSQGIQEYEEVATYYERLHELWAPGGTVQMILLVGKPTGRFGSSPRLDVGEILAPAD